MTVSFVIVLLVHLPIVWTIGVAVALVLSALFVATRPEGPKAVR